MIVYVTFPNSSKQYAYKTNIPMEIGSKYRIVNSRGNDYDNAPVLVVNKASADFRATSVIVKAELVSKAKEQQVMPQVKQVIYNDPATIVFWNDGSKTTVKCAPEDEYNKMVGFLLCVMKKAYGNTGAYNDVLDEFAPYELLKQTKDMTIAKSKSLDFPRGLRAEMGIIDDMMSAAMAGQLRIGGIFQAGLNS